MNSYILPEAFQQSTSYIKVRQELVHTHVAASIRCDVALAIMQEGANCAQRYVTRGVERVTEIGGAGEGAGDSGLAGG